MKKIKKMHFGITLKLMIIYAVQSVCGGIAFYISLFLKNHAGLGSLHVSIAISAISIGNIIGSYIGGYTSDKFNPSYALKIGLAIQGTALLGLVFVTNYYFIFLIMTVMGIGSYLYIISSNFILNSKFNTSNQNRTKIISNQSIISNIGMFIAAILMGYCSAGYYMFIFVAVALVMIIIAMVFKPVDKNFYCINTLDKQENNVNQFNTLFYVIGLFAISLIGIMYTLHRIGYPIFLESSFGSINTGYLMSLNPLIIILFQNFIIKQSTKINEMLALGIGLLFFGISFFILNHIVNVSMIFLSCALMTIGEIFAITYAQSLAFGYAPAEIRGRVLGIYKSIYSSTKMVSAYIAGGLIHYTSYKVLWNFCGFIGITGFLIAIFVMLYTKLKFLKIEVAARDNGSLA